MRYFKKTLGYILLLFFMALTTSCSGLHRHTVNSILPKESFVKVEAMIDIKKCEENLCMEVNQLASHSSGFVVKRSVFGAYVITAGHSCEENDLINDAEANGYKASLNLKIIDIDLKRYDAVVKKIDKKNDICIVFVNKLKRPAIRLNGDQPKYGEKVYNLAAPVGIFDKHMIPVLEGRYSGRSKFEVEISVYTVPAIGGASGSPIINKKGRLVGMIHSVHRRFPFVSFSPTSEILNDFIEDNTN